MFSAPWTPTQDDLGRVRILEKAIQERENYTLTYVEPFDSERPWHIYRGDSFLNHTSFIAKTPSGEAWDLECSVLKNFSNFSGKYSFMVHSFVEIPGKDKIEIQPKEPIFLPISGIPIRLVFWAYSENLPMSLTLILSQEKSKNLYISIGNLNWEGWRRVEVPLSIPYTNVRLIQSRQIPLRIHGIRIQSSPKQEKGPFFFYLDQMYMVLDTSRSFYPGSDVLDNWGN